MTLDRTYGLSIALLFLMIGMAGSSLLSPACMEQHEHEQPCHDVAAEVAVSEPCPMAGSMTSICCAPGAESETTQSAALQRTAEDEALFAPIVAEIDTWKDLVLERSRPNAPPPERRASSQAVSIALHVLNEVFLK